MAKRKRKKKKNPQLELVKAAGKHSRKLPARNTATSTHSTKKKYDRRKIKQQDRKDRMPGA